MALGSSALGLAALASSVMGCAPRTEMIRVARAGPGKLAFGVERHRDKVTGESLGVGVAALSPRGPGSGDRLWRVTRGGTELRYCGATRGESRCMRAQFTAGGAELQERLLIVDPVARGAEGVGLDAFASAGGGGELPVPEGGAVWVLAGGTVRSLHRCASERGRPTCRPAELDGQSVRPSDVLGLYVLQEANRWRDVAWVVVAEQSVVRCQNADPVGVRCARAKFVEPDRTP